MPTCFPSSLPREVLADPRKSSEVAVYRALSEALPDPYSVFYSVAWLAKGRDDQGTWDGEVDFVISHPELGVLVLEVKGGQEIIYDAPTGKWGSRDNRGDVHNIKDPFDQAVRSKHALLRKLKEHPTLSDKWVPVAHAVCFPGVAKGKWPLRPDAPLEIVIDRDDLQHMLQRIEAIFDYWRGGDTRRLGESGQDAVRGILARSLELRMPLGRAARDEGREMLRLTEEQYGLLDSMARIRRMAILGGAGTGKTMLAVEKARRLAAEGFRTLLTCFNIPLEQYLRESLGEIPGLTVQRFHRLCYEAAENHGVQVRPMDLNNRDDRYWNEELPHALMEARGQGFTPFDAIVVDEAQDLNDAYWLALMDCLADPDQGILYVFLDEHQAIYNRETGFLAELQTYILTGNLRNTKAIHAFAESFGPEQGLEGRGPEGRPVEVVALEGKEKLEKKLEAVLIRLSGQEQVPPEEIAVLTGRRPEHLGLEAGKKLGEFSTTDAESHHPGHLMLDTIHRFKGLEAPVVILTGLDGMHPKTAEILLYVGITRAKNHLVVVESEEVLRRYGLSSP